MSLRLLYIITPLSGYLKNYIKYKRVNVLTFSRTPIVYTLIDRFLCYYKFSNTLHNIVVWTIILERWFFFYFKMIRSYINDDYRVRRLKYEKKYSIIYDKSNANDKPLPEK